MSITLILALILPACTPSNTEPEWPVDLASIAPAVDDDASPGGLGFKCEIDMFGMPPDLAPVVQRALAACRKQPPPLEAAAAYEDLYVALRAIRGRSFEVRSTQSLVGLKWRSELNTLATQLTRSTMRPTAKCVGPVP